MDWTHLCYAQSVRFVPVSGQMIVHSATNCREMAEGIDCILNVYCGVPHGSLYTGLWRAGAGSGIVYRLDDHSAKLRSRVDRGHEAWHAGLTGIAFCIDRKLSRSPL